MPKKLGFVLAIMILISGCATIIHGPNQTIGVSSSPTSARVSVNGQTFGTTPALVKLASKTTHVIKVELDGYMPFEATVTKKVSGWVWGNIVFGGFIGLAVDAATGSLYRLTPEQLSAQLSRQTGNSMTTKDHIYFILTPTVDSDWVKVGQLIED